LFAGKMVLFGVLSVLTAAHAGEFGAFDTFLAGGQNRAALLDPSDPEWATPAPAQFRARFTTTKGDFVIEVNRAWAPRGADRFYNLVRLGFYDDTRVYRIRAGVFAQFGLSGDPAINVAWYQRIIPDDPTQQTNIRGRVFFAMRGPDDRTTQAVINLRDNDYVGSGASYSDQGFVPFGEVIDGMEVVDALYSEYGETAGGGMRGGNQGRIVAEGNAHLDADFPRLDRIIRASIQ
jgi:cyclophilin family peptidyl-prolyl cis-trans isomerase